VYVHAKVNKTDVGVAAMIVHVPFNCYDLSANDKMSGYNDTSFSHNKAMSADQIQQFLEKHGSGLKDFTENGKTAAQIIKNAADTSKINPKIILVTLQKEQRLISDSTPTQHQLDHAMGQNGALGFTNQVNGGASTFAAHFTTPQFIPLKIPPYKFKNDGSFNEKFEQANCMCGLPELTSDKEKKTNWTAVQFLPSNKSTYTQFKYTPVVIDFYNLHIQPRGGVYFFYYFWIRYFPD
jgi:hypothetical protein